MTSKNSSGLARRRGRRLALALAVVAVLGLGATPAGAGGKRTAPAPIEGLVGPLGLAIGQDGSIYVAEGFAGRLTTVDKKGRRSVLVEGNLGGGVDARGRGNVAFTESIPPAQGGAPETFLNTVNPNGEVRRIAPLSAYEEAANPDARNVYGIIAVPGAPDLDACSESIADPGDREFFRSQNPVPRNHRVEPVRGGHRARRLAGR